MIPGTYVLSISLGPQWSFDINDAEGLGFGEVAAWHRRRLVRILRVPTERQQTLVRT